MRRFFPWILLLLLMILLTRFFDMSIQYVRPLVDLSVSNEIRPSVQVDDLSLSTSPPLSTSNLENTSTTSTMRFFPVVRVIDGDTIEVLEGDVKVRVRLIGINTPEAVDPRRTVQCFGKEASQKTRDLLSGGLVKLVNDASQDTYDKYRRRLAYVFTPSGTLVNLELIKQGYAYEYTYRTPYEHQAEFKQAERDAREGERGLWAPGVCASVSKKVSLK